MAKISVALVKFKLIHKIILILGLMELGYINIYGQNPSLSFKHFTIDNGLADNHVSNIFQDSQELIWIATENGLNKFDGYDFSIYKFNPQDSSSLSHNKVMAIKEDQEGKIWIATWGGGISILDKKTEKFARLLQKPNEPATLPSNFIYTIFKDSEGKMWVGTTEGMALIDAHNYQIIKQYRQNYDDVNSLTNNKVRAIVQDVSGNLWLATNGGGLNYFDLKAKKFRDISKYNKVIDKRIITIYYDSKQRLWIGTWEEGAYMIDKDQKIHHFKNQSDSPQSLLNNQVESITEDAEGQIWLGNDGGISIYNEKNQNFFNYSHHKYDFKSLSSPIVKFVYADKHKRMWIGTLNGGLNLFDKHFVDFKHFYNTDSPQSLSNNDVSTVLYDRRGNIFIGTDGGGLNILNLKNKSFRHFRYDAKNPSGIANDKIKTIFEDSKGQIWIGFWGAGFDKFDVETETFIHHSSKAGDNHTPNNNNIMDIKEDENGNLWLATFGGGVNKYTPSSGLFEYFLPDKNDKLSIKYENVRVLDYYKGILCIGQEDGSIDWLDTKTGKSQGIKLKGIHGNNYAPMSMKRDALNRLWIGTLGGGLWLINETNFSFTTYTTEIGLPSNYICSIEASDNNVLWLGTNNGLCSFNLTTKEVNSYGKNNGLQGWQFNRNASGKLPDGNLIFGGSNGLNIFQPKEIISPQNEYPIVFTKFEIFNKIVEISPTSPLSVAINETSKITLTYQQSLFSITYASLNYSNAEMVNYCYRLKGFVDESWQKVGKERKATYSNLKAGTYIFEVGIVGKDNKQQGKTRSLIIVVLPPWWETWWFRAFLVLFIVGSAWLYYKNRITQLKTAQKTLEAKVALRTKQLQDSESEVLAQNEELVQQSEQLKLAHEEIVKLNQNLEKKIDEKTKNLIAQNKKLTEYAFYNAHKVRGPLARVLGLISIIYEETDLNIREHYLLLLKKTAEELDLRVKEINAILAKNDAEQRELEKNT